MPSHFQNMPIPMHPMINQMPNSFQMNDNNFYNYQMYNPPGPPTYYNQNSVNYNLPPSMPSIYNPMDNYYNPH